MTRTRKKKIIFKKHINPSKTKIKDSLAMMANPQWKNFQPPMQDPAILAYQPRPSAAALYTSPLLHNHASTNGVSSLIRETGVIEKLLHSYGFIQCCERDSRLFFHYSEYSENIDTIKIGDSVEFQMSTDRKTGKPVACSILKLDGIASFEVVNEEALTGTVVTEPKAINRRHSLTGIQDGMGRVSYERSGECFFLPFSFEDVEEGAKIKTGDHVNFIISTDKRNGNIRARKVKPLQPFKPLRYNGVVCSMKDSYGFIERSDVVKEIFFHYSEYQGGNINELLLGDDVEFGVAERNGKEVATDIQRLPEGTVVFEDVSLDRAQGKVVKTLKSVHNRRQSDPLAGRIVYTTKTGQVEIPYGDKDQRGDYTLQCGDLVEFNIATDRRDKLQRATNIDLHEDTFTLTGEVRESGMVATLKEGYGFIRCATRDVRMFFHFSEAMDPNRNFQLQDEVDFTVIQDPTSTNREIAIRIKHLLKGSISIKTAPEKLQGVIEREPCFHTKSPSKNLKDPELGFIAYEVNGNKQSIPYSTKDIHDIRQIPKLSEKVEFTISTDNSSKRKMAVNIRILRRTSVIRQQGFIATIKDSFGFIENGDHDKEVFFHFSAFDGDPTLLDLADEVEYTLSRKNSKVCAESIRKLQSGTVSQEETLPGVNEGKIIRPMRIINPDQDEYCGLVLLGHVDGPDVTTYPYGITSLADKRDFLQKGDSVKFQLCTVKSTGKIRATNIAAARKCVRATVDSMKGQFGFLNHEAEEGKKLFFHMTEVHDGADIRPGDEVEFVIVQNQRNGKYSACSVRKLSERRRPERLISRLKSLSEDGAPKLIVIRQPRGPDGTKGFRQERSIWKGS